MNLVQKLPIGLGLACVMMMTSCSKEDVQTPEPKVESVNTHSNLKADPIPWIAPTKGYPGYNILPTFWERYNSASDPIAYPTGTSNPIYLWGNTASPFKQSLSTIPGQPWSSFVTLTSSSMTDLKKKSVVETKLRFLIPGKTYALTVYVATALPKWKGLGPIPTYAKRCELWVAGPSVGIKTYNVDLTNQTNTWVKKTIIFEAKIPEMTFVASALPTQEGQHAWAHIFVGQEALVRLN